MTDAKNNTGFNRLRKYFPIVDWLSCYKCADFSGDLMAGLIVAVVLVPQAMAYAMLAGLPPQIGLYSCIFPPILYALMGSCRTLAVGPVGLMSLMVGSAIAQMNLVGVDSIIGVAVTLAFLSGILLVLMYLVHMGSVVNFISHPVISGFTSAAALVIAFSQIKHLVGVDIPQVSDAYGIFRYLMQNISELNPTTTFLGFSALVIMVGLRSRLFERLLSQFSQSFIRNNLPKSAPLIAVVFGTVVVWYFRLDDNAGVSIVGNVPAGLPSLTIPRIELELWHDLLISGTLIAIVGFLESVSVAKALASRKRQKIDANQELLALGAANLSAAFSGGYSVAGGFGRSMVNYSAGAKTPLASLITVVLMALSLIFLTPLLYFLPRCVLAAIIIVAVSGLFDIKTLKHTWAYDKAEAMCLVVTFIAVLGFGIELGILYGVLVSIVFQLYRSSQPHIAIVGRVGDSEHFRNVKRHKVKTSPNLILIRIDENLYFANINFLEDEIMALIADNKEAQHLVLICSAVNVIDSSALELLDKLVDHLKQAGVKLYLAEVKGPVMDKLEKTPFLQKLGRDKVFLSTHHAMKALAGI